MELILMDTNEKSSAPDLYADMVEAFGADKLRVVNLFCDYAIPLGTGLLAIERKTPGDLLASIGDGRVFKQVETMAEEARFSFIVVHGQLDTSNDYVRVNGQLTNWQSVSVRGAIRSLMLAGCPVEIVPAQYFIRSVKEIVKLCEKPDHQHSNGKRAITFRDVTMSDKDREEYKRVEFIASLPGIGRKRAEAIMRYVAKGDQRFGNIIDALALVSAMGVTSPFVKELSEHWGALTVKRIRGFIGLGENETMLRMGMDKAVTVKKSKGGKGGKKSKVTKR